MEGIEDDTDAKRSELRKKYQQLNNKIAEKGAAREVLEESNTLLEEVKRPQEALTDARLFSKCVRQFKDEADEKRGKNQKFKTDEFTAFLMSRCYGDVNNAHATENDWRKIGSKVQHCLRRAPHLRHLNGAIDPNAEICEPSKKIIRRGTTRSNEPLIATRYTTQTVESAKKNESDEKTVTELTKLVESTLKRVCKKSKDGSVPLFDFILHPTSFSTTIRHMFLVSFLIKERKAAIFTKDKLPYITNRMSGRGGDDSESGQMILSIEKRQWRDLVEALEIKVAAIELDAKK